MCRYFTRFTEEAFAALVGIIFVVESMKKLYSRSLICVGFLLNCFLFRNNKSEAKRIVLAPPPPSNDDIRILFL
jgi:hypothetical protein